MNENVNYDINRITGGQTHDFRIISSNIAVLASVESLVNFAFVLITNNITILLIKLKFTQLAQLREVAYPSFTLDNIFLL